MKDILEPIQNFDWRQAVDVGFTGTYQSGAQVLHFASRIKPYQNCVESKAFVEANLQQAKALPSDAEVLRYASDSVTVDGAFLEMGVCTGKTINFIAALNPHQTIYGFDSFEGLPEDWVRDDIAIKKGSFALKEGFVPPVLHNVKLYKGWFNKVLPSFKAQILKQRPIAFLHIDCDLYSSTKDVFTILKDNIQTGTIIVFDEMYNYPGWQAQEFKAFNELVDAKHCKIEYLAYNPNNEQVAIKII